MMDEKKVTDQLFEEAEAGLPDRLKKYSDAVKESLRLNDMNIADKAMVAPSMHHGFVNCLFTEQKRMNDLKKLVEKKKEELEARYGDDKIARYKTHQMLQQDKKLVKMEEAIEEQKVVIAYLNTVLGIMSKFGFDVKNSVDLMKIM
jgi:competence CoiA-like predicted nuclease